MRKVPTILEYHCSSCNFTVGIPEQSDMLDAYLCLNCGDTIKVAV